MVVCDVAAAAAGYDGLARGLLCMFRTALAGIVILLAIGACSRPRAIEAKAPLNEVRCPYSGTPIPPDPVADAREAVSRGECRLWMLGGFAGTVPGAGERPLYARMIEGTGDDEGACHGHRRELRSYAFRYNQTVVALMKAPHATCHANEATDVQVTDGGCGSVVRLDVRENGRRIWICRRLDWEIRAEPPARVSVSTLDGDARAEVLGTGLVHVGPRVLSVSHRSASIDGQAMGQERSAVVRGDGRVLLGALMDEED